MNVTMNDKLLFFITFEWLRKQIKSIYTIVLVNPRFDLGTEKCNISFKCFFDFIVGHVGVFLQGSIEDYQWLPYNQQSVYGHLHPNALQFRLRQRLYLVLNVKKEQPDCLSVRTSKFQYQH